MNISELAEQRQFPEFSLERLLKTVFAPKPCLKVTLLVDLDEPKEIEKLSFLQKPGNDIQKKGYEVIYQGLHDGVMESLGFEGGEIFAYKTTGGSNLDLPDTCFDVDGKERSFEKEIYPNYDLILCVSSTSATAPLTASAKVHGFRGATMHGMNDTIVRSGLSVDYDEVSTEAEKLRAAFSGADAVEIDFVHQEKPYSLKIELNKQTLRKVTGYVEVDRILPICQLRGLLCSRRGEWRFSV